MSHFRRDLERDLQFLLTDLTRRSGPHLTLSNAAFVPPVDVYETETATVVVIELAGVPPDTIRVVKDGNLLTVSGERRERCDHAKLHLVHMEIAYGPFERQIILPEGLGSEAVRAIYQDGFLRIELPRATPETSGQIRIT